MTPPHGIPGYVVRGQIGEIAFTFCPQAWYLQRGRVPVTHATEARRQAGGRTHRDIGRQTDLVRAVALAQRALLLAIVVALVMLVVLERLSARWALTLAPPVPRDRP